MNSEEFLFKQVIQPLPKRENYELKGYGVSLLTIEGTPCYVCLYPDLVPFILPKGSVTFYDPDKVEAQIRKMKLA